MTVKKPGKITVTNAIKDDTYTAYKVFDASYTEDKSGYSYSTTSVDVAAAAADSDGLFTVSPDPTKVTDAGSYTVIPADGIAAADIVARLETLDTSLFTKSKSATATSKTLVIDDLELGYYFVKNSSGNTKTALALDNVDPEGKVIDKNTATPTAPEEGDPDDPTDDGRFKYAEKAFVGVGETTTFTVQFNTTNFLVETDEESGETTSEQFISYTVTDTPASMKVDASNVSVKVGEDTLTVVDDYTVDYTDGVLTVVVDWAEGDEASYGEPLYKDGALLTVTYNAKVVDLNAENSAVANGLTDKGTTFPIEAPEGTDAVEIENGSIMIVADPSGTYSMGDLVKVEDGVYRPYVDGVDDPGDKYEGTLKGGDQIVGLGEGEYTVVEESFPEGYNPAGNTTVTIDSDDDDKINVEAEFEYKKGAILPTTGGAGTTMLIVLGSVLFMGTALVLVTKKRMYNEGV